MKNDNEWKELENWEEKRKNEELSKFGLNLSGMDMKKGKSNANKIVALMYSINLIQFIFIAFLIIVIISFLATSYGNYNFMMADSKIEKAMLEKYNIEVTIFSKERDLNKHNIKFKMTTNNNENIEFTAIEEKNRIIDDYTERKHKYYFEMWDNINKSYFTVKESIDNDILKYETYIENFDSVEDNMNKIIEFVNYCGENFVYDWNIYIYKDNKKIYLDKSEN